MPSENPHRALIGAHVKAGFALRDGVPSNDPGGSLVVPPSPLGPDASTAGWASWNDDALPAFRTATLPWRGEPPRVWEGLRRAALARTGGCCWLCGAAATRVDHLIAPRAGGPTRLENLVGACVRCSSSRLDGDPLEYAEANGTALTGPQLRDRDAALSHSLQHPVPGASQRSRDACYRLLSESRWPHPRVPMAAARMADGWLCSPLAARTGAYAGALIHAMRQAGCALVSGGLVRVPAERMDAVAASLIERHAIIRAVVLPTRSAAGAAPELHHPAWSKLLDGIEDTRRGRSRKPHQGFNRTPPAPAPKRNTV